MAFFPEERFKVLCQKDGTQDKLVYNDELKRKTKTRVYMGRDFEALI